MAQVLTGLLGSGGRFSTVISKSFFRSHTASMSSFSRYLISPKEFNEAVSRGSTTRIIPLCASWFMPNDPEKRTGRGVFEQSRIPHARFFDLDKVKDRESPYPHMLPSAADFAAAMTSLDIGNDVTVVVYDSKELGLFSAPRVAWTLKVFGHERVHILNNYRLYVQEGYPVDTEMPQDDQQGKSRYQPPATDSPDEAVDFDHVKELVSSHARTAGPRAIVLDARSHGRFTGKDPEPRPGLPSGHMPQSISVPFTDLLDPKTKAMYEPDELRTILEQKGVTGKGPFVSSCGTGVSAAVIDLALEQVGIASASRKIYDGSWTEWAQRATADEGLIVTGEA